ncbi:ATP-dependent RecD-like DNA helicase [Fructobacillus evanidus]|uniref:ATP-dependent RecD2 DNA helicase n=1 Tax=Fructobacillus evanidus TaxID=3064281 RepID=A0ABM9MLZ6_9LACO|nr:ATPase/5<92>-3<92> helicase helicase subunit RecD of the DNA repair enzyme RecBCD (exonuclease V) (RecD) [Fructobacillus sp. LMG 32999]CAK1222328.1 ATPase/5<92>-3<92> helicase helicase subunit RecD of the DNA repair enzyme RecBCD (exonuclease V) (RecD) [Fructobacillus sp. LMG 32999]CAK1225134.1 ATPase/5<92>-3<92> helicase helicase subunit RecD of the DNA repair enzyme RecBCD (exonuclease V) (RecD) [Fructobacillus sp. LMG 32999]CAK1225337.1 ATPase/5<92>-3<92> helicase helicase subunit RecD of 
MARTIREDNQITGTLQNVIFSANDSYFKILSVTVNETDLEDWDEEEIIVTGTFASVKPGSTYAFYGQLVTHPKYGQQFQAARYENQMPADEKGLVAFFAYGDFPGVGKKTAEKIVDHLGQDAIDLILADSSVLTGIVKPKVAADLAEKLQENLGLEKLFLLGHQIGLSADVAGRLFDHYGEEAQEVLQKTPYRLVYEFDSLPFKKVDAIAKQAGFSDDHPDRIQAGVYAGILNACYSAGHTYLTVDQALSAAQSTLQSNSSSMQTAIDQALGALVSQERLVYEDGNYSPTDLKGAEALVSSKVNSLLKAKSAVQTTPDLVDTTFVVPENLDLDEVQRAAVEAALTNQVFVLTGGPGTGKTTVTKTLVATWEALVRHQAQSQGRDKEWVKQNRVRLASPTGRAAKRMTEITGYEATTIHRLLGITDGDDAEFDADNPISGGLLIIDEASMLDISLAESLFAALPKDMHIVLVGDADQLPSVGPGNVLYDLIQSQVVPHVALERIYRQGKGSSISALAQSINAGILPKDFQENQSDRSTFLTTADQVPRAVSQVLQAAVKKGFTANQVQVLAPMYKTPAGVLALNQIAQDLFNPVKPGQKTLQQGETVFRLGDKVLQLENDSERDIYNGDMGQVIAIHYKKEPGVAADSLVVDFDGQEVWYTSKTLNQLTLAYATTIHKAQGNEFKLVILVLTGQFKIMLNQNLVYTAITRAKESLVMVGDYSAYDYAATHPVPVRQTFLQELLVGQQDERKAQGPRASQAGSQDGSHDGRVAKNQRQTVDRDERVAKHQGQTIDRDERPVNHQPQKDLAKQETSQQAQATGSDFADFNHSDQRSLTSSSQQDPVVQMPAAADQVVGESGLTVATLTQAMADPMVGMADLKPADFMPESR